MNKRIQSRRTIAMAMPCLLVFVVGGCSLAPDVRPRDRFHNPLPQLHRIAILPFFNQSSEPTVDGVAIAEAYYAELQAIPGFEVLPVGAVEYQWRMLEQNYPGLERSADGTISPGTLQKFAASIGADALVIGSVTEYSPYSPPRFALTTRWYAANPAFHPVPAGYGLPWGTKAEKRIPRRILLETELEVARAQLATQTPQLNAQPIELPADSMMAEKTEDDLSSAIGSGVLQQADAIDVDELMIGDVAAQQPMPTPLPTDDYMDPSVSMTANVNPLPANWPDPTRLIPDAPNPNGPPPAVPQTAPVLSHTRIYRGDDPDVTEKLADYVYARDDGRLGGWQGYLTRSDDFIRFCCYLHITEMLEMRGGRDQSDLIFRWPISRYWR